MMLIFTLIFLSLPDPNIATLDINHDAQITRADVEMWQRSKQPEARYYWQLSKLAATQKDLSLDATLGGFLKHTFKGYNADSMTPSDLCQNFSALDLSLWQQAKVTPSVIFDLDGTVWPKDVMDGFLQVLVTHKIPQPKANQVLQIYLQKIKPHMQAEIASNDVYQNAALLLALWTDTNKKRDEAPSAKDMFEQIIALLTDVKEHAVEQAAEATFEQGAAPYTPWKNHFFKAADCSILDLVKILKKQGVEIYILSATFDFLAEQAAKQWGIPKSHVIASRLELKNKRYTGKLLESTYDKKAELARLLPPAMFAFGDSPRSDFGLLQQATVAGFMINPEKKLLEQDKEWLQNRLVQVRFNQTEADF